MHPAILTPDQRLRVFISSTLTELASERRRASAAPFVASVLAAYPGVKALVTSRSWLVVASWRRHAGGGGAS